MKKATAPRATTSNVQVAVELPPGTKEEHGRRSAAKLLTPRRDAADREARKMYTVKVISGPVYRAHEIERLHYGPKPA
jgi:hypothetical protein